MFCLGIRQKIRIPYQSPLPLASPPWEEADGGALLGDAESVSFPHGSALLSAVKTIDHREDFVRAGRGITTEVAVMTCRTRVLLRIWLRRSCETSLVRLFRP